MIKKMENRVIQNVHRLVHRLADLCFIDIEQHQIAHVVDQQIRALKTSQSWIEWQETGKWGMKKVTHDLTDWCGLITQSLNLTRVFPDPRWIAIYVRELFPVIQQLYSDLQKWITAMKQSQEKKFAAPTEQTTTLVEQSISTKMSDMKLYSQVAAQVNAQLNAQVNARLDAQLDMMENKNCLSCI